MLQRTHAEVCDVSYRTGVARIEPRPARACHYRRINGTQKPFANGLT